MPKSMRPRATASTSLASSANVHCRPSKTSAGRSASRVARSSTSEPIVRFENQSRPISKSSVFSRPKDAPKRSQAAKELAKKLGVEAKQVYLTSGERDLLLIVESASGDNVAKFALATGALGNVRTSTARAWSEPEWHKLISELP